ncbi:DGQHR domain-containing protein [Bdellovibrio bacteriovorus]|uniref:DGQHR domain-containing protein n=1 Tax=Bdellovibrio bacteriovorus TaxID=959 RepID=UPI003D069459
MAKKEKLISKTMSISAVLITQSKHKFYTCTMHSDLLASCSYVVSRDEDPKKGFQRYLNENRAAEIAEYIDSGFGTIPTSIVLSAQDVSNFTYDSSKKTIKFEVSPHAFLILDGQHRVYGFSKASSKLRVPVVIYEGLTSEEEVMIFIDLNTKQKPVPNELLLDIKKLAGAEKNTEKYLNDLFDQFRDQKKSCLRGRMSSHKKEAGMISRVNFHTSLNPILSKIQHLEPERVFEVLNQYLSAFIQNTDALGVPNAISNTTILGGVMLLFPEVFQKVKDRFKKDLSKENFSIVMEPVFDEVSTNSFKKPGNSKKEFYGKMQTALRNHVQIDF